MDVLKLNVLLADDDLDDCFLFKEVLKELPVMANLSEVYDGVQLMHLLAKRTAGFPDVIFLDLNMPRKNGFDCLLEIKQSKKLRSIPVIIISTSYEQDVANLLYKNGANYYIKKPAEFLELKKVIHHAIRLIQNGAVWQPDNANFLLTSATK